MRENIKFVIIFCLAISVGGFLSFLSVKDSKPKILTSEIHLEAKAEQSPKYSYFQKDEKIKPKISAKSFIVGDLDTGEIILKKDENTRRPIASVSKVMTALVTEDFKSELFETSVSRNALATYGQNGNLRLGEKIKVGELLYPLLLESSNDAAEVLAEFFDRNVFIQKMNEKAKDLNLEDTSFEDPSGLSENNTSTARDLFELAKFVKSHNENLLNITRETSLMTDRHNWSSNNQFLKQEGYLGGKSGYTVPAGQTVISMFNLPLGENGESRNVAIALLGSTDRYKDVTALVKFLKANVHYGSKEKEDVVLAQAPKLEITAPKPAEIISTPTPPPPPAPLPEPEPDFITLSFVGDIMLDRGVESSVRKNFAGDYSTLFEKVGELKESDIVFANLEGPASDQGKDLGSLYSFRMDPTVVPALRAGGIDIVSVANNHMGDYGKDAFNDTLARLRENEILYTGGGENIAEAESPVVFEKNGIRIGFLGFSDVGPEWITAGLQNSGILSAKNPRFAEIIKNASAQVDYLIVSFHWGEEYKTLHNPRQENLAHKAIENGAKLIIGHHPHVAQDTESYRDGFIAYSLGNFIFDQPFSTGTMQGMWLQIKLYQNGNLDVKENTVKLNRLFKPETIIPGEEKQIKFEQLAQ